MEKDAEFEKLLNMYTTELKSPLMLMLKDPRLFWVYEETERIQGVTPPPSLRIFKSDALLPLSTLYALRRKDLLDDAKNLLPFWYYTPLLTAILAFFRKIFKRKTGNQAVESIKNKNAGGKNSDIKEIQEIAAAIEAKLIPEGRTLETCLGELEEKWNRLIDPKLRQNLILDVQSLVNDHLRKMIRQYKMKKISVESIKETANMIITRSQTLYKISDQDALFRYIQLYFVKKLHAIHPDQLSVKIK